MASEKAFFEMDAGEQREFLAEQLADWADAGFWSLQRTVTFHRRVAILAQTIGMRRAELLDVLRADASLDERAGAYLDKLAR